MILKNGKRFALCWRINIKQKYSLCVSKLIYNTFLLPKQQRINKNFYKPIYEVAYFSNSKLTLTKPANYDEAFVSLQVKCKVHWTHWRKCREVCNNIYKIVQITLLPDGLRVKANFRQGQRGPQFWYQILRPLLRIRFVLIDTGRLKILYLL